MKPCPYCAEEIQDAAVRCKHCGSDLVEAAPSSAAPAGRPRRPLRLLAGLVALLAVAVGAPVVARPLLRHIRSDTCQPTSWIEWHAAMRNQCLQPAYVCEHMTTLKLLEDPEVFRSFHGAAGASTGHLSELVGRMRSSYGCAPEGGPAQRGEPGPVAPPAFPPSQDAPRAI